MPTLAAGGHTTKRRYNPIAPSTTPPSSPYVLVASYALDGPPATLQHLPGSFATVLGAIPDICHEIPDNCQNPFFVLTYHDIFSGQLSTTMEIPRMLPDLYHDHDFSPGGAKVPCKAAFQVTLNAPPLPKLPQDEMDGGGFSWSLTFRPRDLLVAPADFFSQIIRKFQQDGPYHILVMEDKNHLHGVSFLWRKKTRSNYVKLWGGEYVNAPLSHFDKDEWDNFRLVHIEKTPGHEDVKHYACKQTTTLDILTSYINGDYEAKADRPFQVISAHLPADLDYLEHWLPRKRALKTPKVYNQDLRPDLDLFKEDHPERYTDDSPFITPGHNGDIDDDYILQWWTSHVLHNRLPRKKTAKDIAQHVDTLLSFIHGPNAYKRGAFYITDHNAETPNELVCKGRKKYCICGREY